MLVCVRVCSEMMKVLQVKERRAQQQLDRCAEERGRKMEEQRRKEQKRRAAAEEKRRQQQEAEKVRGHSTPMMRSLHIRANEKTQWHAIAVVTSTDAEITFLQFSQIFEQEILFNPVTLKYTRC